MRRAATNAILLICALLVALLLAEGVLRLFRLAPGTQVEELGERKKIVRDREFRYTVETNSIGVRDVREFAPSARGRRIVFAGDSFVFGNGVSNQETFAAVTEALLDERSSSSWQVLNAGRPGAGTILEAAVVRDLTRRLHVDGVVLFYFVDNDPYDTLRESTAAGRDASASQQETVARMRLETPSLRVRRWLAENTALYRFLRVRLVTHGTLREYPFTILDQCAPQLVDRFREMDGLTRETLAALRADLQERGVGYFDVVMLPRQEQISDTAFRRFTDSYRVSDRGYNRFLPQRRLQREVFGPLGIEAVDLLPELDGKDPAQLFFPFDGHLSVPGNRFVAERMADLLLRRFPDPAPAP